MKNGKQEVWIGSEIRINGYPMVIEGIENSSVIIRDGKKKKTFIYGLDAFRTILWRCGYELEEGRG